MTTSSAAMLRTSRPAVMSHYKNLQSAHEHECLPYSSSNGSTTSLMDVLRHQGTAMLLNETLRPRHPYHADQHDSWYTTPATSTSKPIRISSSDAHDGSGDEVREEEELEHFYDQATWRMYMLIQSARVSQGTYGRSSAASARATGKPTFTTTTHQQQQWTTLQAAAPVTSGSHEQDQEPEDDGAIFDMEL